MESLTKTEYVDAFLSNYSPNDSMSIFRQRLEQVRLDNDMLSQWIRERMDIERQYSDQLHKLAMNMQEKNNSSFAFNYAWKQLEGETLEISRYHSQIIGQIASQVYKPLIDYYTSSPQTATLRRLAERLSTVAEEMASSSVPGLKGLKKKGRDADTKSQNDLTASRATWDSDAPLAFEKLQIVDEERLLILKQVYLTIASLETDTALKQQEFFSKSMAVYSDLPIEGEIRQFMNSTSKVMSSASANKPSKSSGFHINNGKSKEEKSHGENESGGKLKNKMSTLFRRKTIMPKKDKKPSHKSNGRPNKLTAFFNKNSKASSISSAEEHPSNIDDSSIERRHYDSNHSSQIRDHPSTNNNASSYQNFNETSDEGEDNDATIRANNVRSSFLEAPLPVQPNVQAETVTPKISSKASPFNKPNSVHSEASRNTPSSIDRENASHSNPIMMHGNDFGGNFNNMQSRSTTTSPTSAVASPAPTENEDSNAAIERVANTLRKNPTISRRTRRAGTMDRYATASSDYMESNLGSLPNLSTLSLQSGPDSTATWHPEFPNSSGLSASIVEKYSGELSEDGLLHPSCSGHIFMKYTSDFNTPPPEMGVRVASEFPMSFTHLNDHAVKYGPSENTLSLIPELLLSPIKVTDFNLHLDSINGASCIPLTVVQKWKHDESSSSMIAFVKPNPVWRNLGSSLHIEKLVIIVYLGENVLVKSCQSSPAGEFSRKTSKLKLHLSNINISSSGFKILAKFAISPSAAIRKPVIEFRIRMVDSSNNPGLTKLFLKPDMFDTTSSSGGSQLESAYEETKVPTSYGIHVRECSVFADMS
ncbi:F-BAR domain protein Syp1 [Schizosaccharomyces pombe]|uniref:Cytoskeletal protein syp1 n=1 Tax=Schizosaccharomyces pombe (strain 972 / ATCC 24843) TaxID=284812 RepID=SYP1_SCHPO|nr:putative cytoskeletal protein Syp1 [Schizosaccharomyces pombe]O43059.1 RecName: Full=Cytoskeletal protein syp1 [Schizosaccharomyces pombe 972h-]CAA16828.1 cytoskeletal protein Syp1 (predicted) [Schizosaccharomyces pombe]|eukprot:NP_596299.1 putative cytoskeletal protein Syp1 [Schizosaccharomyces pombe]